MVLLLSVARLAYFEELLNKVKEIDTSGSFDSEGFLRGRGVGPILAATSCSFKFPLTYPDEALLTSSIHVDDDVKETGFGMTYQVCVFALNWPRIHARPCACSHMAVDAVAGLTAYMFARMFDTCQCRWSVRHKRLAAVGRGEVVAFNYGQGKAEPFPTIINEAIVALEQQSNLHLLPEFETLDKFDA